MCSVDDEEQRTVRDRSAHRGLSGRPWSNTMGRRKLAAGVRTVLPAAAPSALVDPSLTVTLFVGVQTALSVGAERLTVRPADVTDHQDEIGDGDGNHEQHGYDDQDDVQHDGAPSIARAEAMFSSSVGRKADFRHARAFGLPCPSTRLWTMSQDARRAHVVSGRSLTTMHVAPMTYEHARDICTWRYAPPYERYDMTGAEPGGLVQPEAGFRALLAGHRLIGFRSFGPDGQVPGWDYDDRALDTGGGLHPTLVGQGLGAQAISAGLAFGRAQFAPQAFRVTVATFNARALRTVEGLGFERVGRFDAATDGRGFEVLVRPEA